MTRYHTLVIREAGIWAPQFGSYSRTEAECEMRDWLDGDTLRRDAKLITTNDYQVAIDAEVARMNSMEPVSACDHDFHEVVCADGKLMEPAADVCVQCGATR